MMTNYLTSSTKIEPPYFTTTCSDALTFFNILFQPMIDSQERDGASLRVQYAARISNRCNSYSPTIDHNKRNCCSRCLPCHHQKATKLETCAKRKKLSYYLQPKPKLTCLVVETQCRFSQTLLLMPSEGLEATLLYQVTEE